MNDPLFNAQKYCNTCRPADPHEVGDCVRQALDHRMDTTYLCFSNNKTFLTSRWEEGMYLRHPFAQRRNGITVMVLLMLRQDEDSVGLLLRKLLRSVRVSTRRVRGVGAATSMCNMRFHARLRYGLRLSDIHTCRKEYINSTYVITCWYYSYIHK